MGNVEILPPRLVDAARRYQAENGVSVEEIAGTHDPALILVATGHLEPDPKLPVTPRLGDD